MLFTPQNHGQGLVEYAIILMLVALVVILGVTFFGEMVRNLYVEIVAQI
jgi:pilus assembly protein Flp/PilA